jgi:putative ABC transport system permease protein
MTATSFNISLKLALRNAKKHGRYTAIIIMGLAVGIAASLMILLYIDHELSYDAWIPDHERVMRLEADVTNRRTGEIRSSAMTPPVFTPMVADSVPEIAAYARINGLPVALSTGENAFNINITLSDPDIFSLMGVTFVEGSAEGALRRPDGLILTESSAHRLFGTTNVVGESVRADAAHSLVITGVIQDWPKNSDLDIKALAPHTSPIAAHNPQRQTSWFATWGTSYMKLAEGADPANVAASINALARRTGPTDLFEERIAGGERPVFDFKLTPARDAHLTPGREVAQEKGSHIQLWSAATVAFSILVVAVINAANLGTMIAIKRVQEISVRKLMGAARSDLTAQIMLEFIAVALTALLIGLALTEIALPGFGYLMNRPLTVEPVFTPMILSSLMIIAVGIGVISGLYPALVAARFRPSDTISGIKPRLDLAFRNSLIVFQFAVTSLLLVTSIIMFLQTRYASSRDTGYETSNLLVLSGIERPAAIEREASLRRALEAIPGVSSVAAAMRMPGDNWSNGSGITLENGERVLLRRFSVTETFFDTLEITPIAGRVFSPDFPGDATGGDEHVASRSVVVNRSALNRLGISAPEDAVGVTFETSNGFRSTIVGVVEDMHFKSARREVEETYFWIGPFEYRHIILRLDEGSTPATLKAVDDAWATFMPDLPLVRSFADSAFANYYDQDRRQNWLISASVGFMILIAATGLYGLAALTTDRRAKEIGIRKTVGAQARNIVNLLLWQFSKPIIAANLIAWPLGWWLMSRWLEGFVDRIALTPIPFLMAGVFVLIIGWMTIIGHTLKLARLNPIEVLR